LCIVQVVLGTDLADFLRSRGFRGLVLIRSANASDEERAMYMRSGSVDGCIGKEGSNKEVALSIKAQFVLKRDARH
jgi:hypothetical protein